MNETLNLPEELKQKIADYWARQGVNKAEPKEVREKKILEGISPQERYRQKGRLQAIDKLGGKCEECGYDKPNSLMMVSKDGTHKGWCDVHQAVLRGSDNYRLLCRNCEWDIKSKNVGRPKKCQ